MKNIANILLVFVAALQGAANAAVFGDELAKCVVAEEARTGIKWTPDYPGDFGDCNKRTEALFTEKDSQPKIVQQTQTAPLSQNEFEAFLAAEQTRQAAQPAQQSQNRSINLIPCFLLVCAIAAIAYTVLRLKLWQWRPRTRRQRVVVIGLPIWFAYVVFRSSGNHELFGKELIRWNSDEFYFNFLGPLVAVLLVRWAYKWILQAER